jgi:putative redox protein
MTRVQVKGHERDKYRQSIKAGTHVFVSDAPKEIGGDAGGPEPHELLLGALGACTSITMRMYAQRCGWDLQDVTVDLEEERIEDPNEPGKKIPKITRSISVTGKLTADQIEGLKGVADKCPIHKLLSGHKIITTDIKPLTSV